MVRFFSPHFFSSQITLKNLTNQEVATFTYGDWLSKLKNATGSLVCEMPAVINDEQMMEDTTYTLQVKTSDIGGWSLLDILLIFYYKVWFLTMKKNPICFIWNYI